MTDEVKLSALIGEGIKSHEERKEAWILAGKTGERPTIMDSIADHLLANGETFATDNNVGGKWIPVTERLPEDGVRVLAAHDDGVVRIGISRGYFPSVVSRNHTKAFGITEVTHWMPLPEPPKGD